MPKEVLDIFVLGIATLIFIYGLAWVLFYED